MADPALIWIRLTIVRLPMKPDIIVGKITSNPEITNVFWMQICEFKNAITIDDKKKEELIGVVLEVMKKLESVNYHRSNLERIVEEKLAAMESVRQASYDRTTGAEKEFEAFLLQGKATLDVLVKVLSPLCNIKLQTYSDSGSRVLKALKNNLPKGELERADWLMKMIEVSVPWLQQWVGPYRDTIAHYKSMDSTGFLTIPDASGNLVHHPPRDKRGMLLHELANSLFSDLVVFCEDFLVFAYRIKIFKGFEIGYTDEHKRTNESPCKYGLFMVNYTERS